MKLNYLLSTLLVSLSFIGCASNTNNNLEKIETKKIKPANIMEIQIQTPKWKYKQVLTFTVDKFNGLVFSKIPGIDNNFKYIILYPSGYAKIHLIKTKSVFNSYKEYISLQPYVNQKLYYLYPKTIVYNIITGHPIFGGINKQYSADGLRQSIFGKHMSIIYRADEKSSYFNDREQNITIKIKHLN